ncbi:hypothetical protein CXG81DRAFT_14532, partial [Caulochytrium protostelioides]
MRPSGAAAPVRCINALTVSSWNPPPPHRVLQGDLLYLRLVTLEDRTYEITCCVDGFFVNNSKAHTFDPSMRSGKSAPKIQRTLIALLESLSDGFTAKFALLQQQLSRRHPHEYVLTQHFAYPWVTAEPDHVADAGRLLDAYLQTSETSETFGLHDWNDEIQAARELPRASPHERVARDQALHRVHSDFIAASVAGATAIAQGSLAPINPDDPPEQQLFLHNNIFYSQGADAEQTGAYGGARAAHVIAGKDVQGAATLTQMDLPDLFLPGTALIDVKGMRLVAQTIVPGILRAKADEPNITAGSVDNGQTILDDAWFADKFGEVAKKLNLQPHVVTDGEGAEHTVHLSLDTKGINGTDGRKYILDLSRMTPVDITWLDAHPRYPHAMALLRPEALEHFFHHQMQAQVLAKIRAGRAEAGRPPAEVDAATLSDIDELAPEVIQELSEMDASDHRLSLDAFTHVKPQNPADQDAVRAVSRFVGDELLPRAAREMAELSGASLPADGAALTRWMHRQGLNMRYLGPLATTLRGLDMEDPSSSAQYAIALCELEMVARVLKRVIRGCMQAVPFARLAACVAHMLSCVFTPLADRDATDTETEITPPSDLSDYSAYTPASLWHIVRTDITLNFDYEADFTATFSPATLSTPVLLRRLCLQLGLQLRARAYTPAAGEPLFTAQDLLHHYPVIKQVEPTSRLAEEAVENGRRAVYQNAAMPNTRRAARRAMGIDLLQEGYQISEQVLGPIHPATGRLAGHMATVMFGEQEAREALAWQLRAVLACERTLGVDHTDTLQECFNLAYFLFQSEQAAEAEAVMRHTLVHWKRLTTLKPGLAHPDSIAVATNLGAMAQTRGDKATALRHFRQTLALAQAARPHAQGFSSAAAFE